MHGVGESATRQRKSEGGQTPPGIGPDDPELHDCESGFSRLLALRASTRPAGTAPTRSAAWGRCRIPDLFIPSARSIYDATIAEKTISLPQTIDFRAFSGGGNVTIVRPSTLVTPGAQGSYGLYFP